MQNSHIGCSLSEFNTIKEVEEFMHNHIFPDILYEGIYQTPDGYHEWFMWKEYSHSFANKFMQNPNREDIESPHTRDKADILKLWITKENGKELKKPKLIWTKKKGQINQKPEPTLEETIKRYLKKQRI